MEELINKVIQWANDRNLIKGSDAKTQCLKLVSEFGELNLNIKRKFDIKDDIGDCIVVSIILSEMAGYNTSFIISTLSPYIEKDVNTEILRTTYHIGGLSDSIIKGNGYATELTYFIWSLYAIAGEYKLTPKECLEHSYEQIKNRTGVMWKGCFIKESDERYESAVREIRGEA